MDLRSVRSWPAPKDQTLGLTPDGGAVTLVMPSGEVVFNSTQTGEELFSLPAPEFRPSYVSGKFNRTGRLLAVRYEQGERRQWKSLGPASTEARSRDEGWRREALVRLRPRMTPGSCSRRKARTIRILDLETGAVAEEFGQGLMANAVAVHPGGRLIAFSSELGNKVYIYDRGVRRVIRSLAAVSGDAILGVAWHPNGRVLAGVRMGSRRAPLERRDRGAAADAPGALGGSF
jgi:WD40 repeat protein